MYIAKFLLYITYHVQFSLLLAVSVVAEQKTKKQTVNSTFLVALKNMVFGIMLFEYHKFRQQIHCRIILSLLYGWLRQS